MASVGPSSTRSPGLMPSMLTTGTMPPITIGNWTRPFLSSSSPVERRVGGAEGDGLGLDLLDAAAGADRLVVQADAGLLLVGVGPLGVDRVGEGRAGAGNIGGGRRPMAQRRRWRRPRAGRGTGQDRVSRVFSIRSAGCRAPQAVNLRPPHGRLLGCYFECWRLTQNHWSGSKASQLSRLPSLRNGGGAGLQATPPMSSFYVTMMTET